MAYTVYVIPQAWQEMKALPGNMRQRIKHTVDGLADEPTPQRVKSCMLLLAELFYTGYV